MTCRNILLTLSILFACVSASSQEFPDSASWGIDMEDSISAMTIRPVRHPEKLLDSILSQVISDTRQQPLPCKYMVTLSTGRNISQCIFHAVSSVRIKAMGEAEKFHYQGPRRLTSLYDTASVYYALRDCLEGDYIMRLVHKNSHGGESVLETFHDLMRLHRIKVYSISDESGRGMYRVSFSPRKGTWYYGFAVRFTGAAYFDRNTLRLIQVKTDKTSPTSFDVMGRQDKKPLSHLFHSHYEMTFEEAAGTLVVRRIDASTFVDEQLKSKYIVQRVASPAGRNAEAHE